MADRNIVHPQLHHWSTIRYGISEQPKARITNAKKKTAFKNYLTNVQKRESRIQKKRR
jgi:hypothetical protein